MDIYKVIFSNLENPGGDLVFNYGVQKYELFDGKEYTLPINVVEHLNELAYEEPTMRVNNDGNVQQYGTKKIYRFNCRPSEPFRQIANPVSHKSQDSVLEENQSQDEREQGELEKKVGPKESEDKKPMTHGLRRQFGQKR